MTTTPVPHWDLSNVYPALESKEFEAAIAKLKGQLDELEQYFADKVGQTEAKTPLVDLAATVGGAIDRLNTLTELAATIRSYLYSFVSTNSRDKIAMKKMSEFEQLGVRMQKL